MIGCGMVTELEGFSTYRFAGSGRERTIYHCGPDGRPGVILLHGLPGMVPECVEFARELSRPTDTFDGYQVYMPLLFGRREQKQSSPSMRTAMFGVMAEMRLLASSKRSKITSWVAENATTQRG